MKMCSLPSMSLHRIFCLLAGGILFSSLAFGAEFREFKNTSGQSIQGKITSATDTEVTLQLSDGREITGGINYFSPGDQKFIAEWKKKHPAQIDYDFGVDFSRERTDRNEKREGNIEVTYEDWIYNITVENRSKDGNTGAAVSGLELQYNLIKTAKAKAREASYLHSDMSPSKGKMVKPGKVSLETMKYLDETKVSTEVIPITASELAPGWYYADGTKDEQNDEFEGIWIQIYKDGRKVYEAKHGTKEAELTKWVPPKGGRKA